MLVARAGYNIEMTKIFLSAGVDPNAVTKTGVTALTLAREAGNREMIQLLIDAGAR
jgi:ankyrin repeat protein